MRHRVLGVSLVLFTCALTGRAAADDEGSAWTPAWSGYVDGTYNYNFNVPADGVNQYNAYTGRHHTFLLNAAHLALSASNDSLAMNIELDAGSDATVNTYTYGNNYVDVQEAWVAYTDAAGFGLKAGKFVTYNGIEVIEGPANPTISRGLLFLLAEPVFHVGAMATYKINDQLDAAVGVVNGWDNVVDNNASKTIVAKFGVTTDAFLLTMSALAGPEQNLNNKDWRTTFDATGMAKVGIVDLWFQANAGMEQEAAGGGDDASWIGVGVQPVFHVDDRLTVGGRVELFDDLDGARSAAKQVLTNVSVTPGYAVTDHFTLRAEGRFDMSNEEVFDGHKNQVMALTEAIVTF